MDDPRNRAERSRNTTHCWGSHHDHRGRHCLDQPLSGSLISHQSRIPLHRWSRPNTRSPGQHVYSLRVRYIPCCRLLRSRPEQHRHGRSPAREVTGLAGISPPRSSRHGRDGAPEPQLRRQPAHADILERGTVLDRGGERLWRRRPHVCRRTSGAPSRGDWPHSLGATRRPIGSELLVTAHDVGAPPLTWPHRHPMPPRRSPMRTPGVRRQRPGRWGCRRRRRG